MLRKMFFSLAAMGLAATSQAAVMITQESAPTVGLEGYTTFTLSAESTEGPIIGFNFANPLGFFGPMNQVNPFGVSTLWMDLNDAINGQPGGDVSQDSQFLLLSNAGTRVGELETMDSLQAAIAFAANPKQGPFAFVQLAIPDAAEASVEFSGMFQVRTPTGDIDEAVSGRVGGAVIPEPSTIALAGLALLGLIGYVRRK